MFFKFFVCFVVFSAAINANPILVSSEYPMIGVNPEHNFQANVPAQVDRVQWKFPIAISPFSGPVTVRIDSLDSLDLVIAAGTEITGYFLSCLEETHAQIFWQANLSASVVGFPAVDVYRNQVLVVAGDSLLAFSLISGTRMWSVRLLTQGQHPTIWKNFIYVTDAAGYLSAYSANGNLRWRQGPLGGGLFNTTATVDSFGNVYIGTLGNQLLYYDWKVYSFDSLGNQRWMREYLAFEPGGIRMTMALLRPDKVVHHNFYQPGWQCGVYCLTPQGVQWRYGPIEFRTCYSSIAFDKVRGRLYLGTNQGLLVLDTVGNFIREIQIGSITYSSPLIDSLGNIIIGTDAGLLYILDPNGQTIFKRSTGDGLLGSPAISKTGRIFIAGQARLWYFSNLTGIAEIDKKNIQRFAAVDNKIYNILGQEVRNAKLLRGVYFKGGKKIIVR